MAQLDLWVEEKDQHSAETLPLLTDPEQAVYQAIKRNTWGQNVRIWTPPRLQAPCLLTIRFDCSRVSGLYIVPCGT